MATDAGPGKDPTNGTWWFVVDLAPSGDGRRRQAKRRDFKTKADAQAALDNLRVASRQGTTHVIKGMQTDAAEKVAALILGPTSA